MLTRTFQTREGKAMSGHETLRFLHKVGAVITDSHIVYSSGKHGSVYINKDAVYPHTKVISGLCHSIAQQFENKVIDVVIAPATGGIVLTQWVAHHMTKILGREVLSVYAEKDKDGNFAILRSYDKIVKGKRVLVVEDILNTGASARKVVEATSRAGGNVIGVGVILNRGGVKSTDLANVPMLRSLVNMELDSHDEKKCPLCAEGVPINTEVGHGKKFLERKRLMDAIMPQK